MFALSLFLLAAACVVLIIAITDGDNRVLRKRVAELEREKKGDGRCR